MLWCTAMKFQFQWDFPCFNCHRFCLAKIGYLSLTSCHKVTIHISKILSIVLETRDINLLHQTLKLKKSLKTKKLLDDENLSKTASFRCGRSLFAVTSQGGVIYKGAFRRARHSFVFIQ